ncbi:YybH family protein [Mucilaginibacter sp. McL0603]|uniref:YybH family protein n=1 Tax=Mucilaginibacter sp. McL0603 TaxID=3415670 RepID=UPI003CEA2D19
MKKLCRQAENGLKLLQPEISKQHLAIGPMDAVVMSPGQPVLKGKKEIRQMIEGSFKIPGFKITWEPQSVQVSQIGDLAYLVEKSQIVMNDSSGKAVTQHYNGVTVWKKQSDGSWKNVADIATNEP